MRRSTFDSLYAVTSRKSESNVDILAEIHVHYSKNDELQLSRDMFALNLLYEQRNRGKVSFHSEGRVAQVRGR